MRVAFAIVKLFAGGGLQRDCVEIAKVVQRAGHQVVIFSSHKDESDFARGLDVSLLPAKGRTNHRIQAIFSAAFRAATAGRFDLLVGFNKLAGLDVLYCADRSISSRLAGAPVLVLLPRYRTFKRLEGASFQVGQKTKTLVLSRRQADEYSRAWRTEPERMILLPPTVAPDRRKPEHRADGTRAGMRRSLAFAADDFVWIAVCSQPRTKGLDRVVRALREFPDARLLVVGLAETSSPASRVLALARRLGLSSRIKWLGLREDIPELMAAADLLVHPARYDTTGTVILEAIVNGLPVITTAACGYADHVEAARSGIVLAEPFRFETFVAALDRARDAEQSRQWSNSAIEYGVKPELYQGRARAAEFIIRAAEDKLRGARCA